MRTRQAIFEAADGTNRGHNAMQLSVSTIVLTGRTVDGIYGSFFGKVPVIPVRVVASIGAHVEIQAVAFVNRT